MNKDYCIKPEGTTWVKCVLFIAYDCDSPPEVDERVITGVEQLGFIISHEYLIVPKVAGYRKVPCEFHGVCEQPVMYEFDVRVSVFDKIGLGIGFGPGTGTLGVKFNPRHSIVSLRTDCMCCEAPPSARLDWASLLRNVRLPRQETLQAGQAIVLLAVLGLLGYATANLDQPALRVIVSAMGVLAGTSIFGIGWRLSRTRPSTTPSLPPDAPSSTSHSRPPSVV